MSSVLVHKVVQNNDFRSIASVGLFAIQLAKLSGYKVITAVSPKNFELVKSLGADAFVSVSPLITWESKATPLTQTL